MERKNGDEVEALILWWSEDVSEYNNEIESALFVNHKPWEE